MYNQVNHWKIARALTGLLSHRPPSGIVYCWRKISSLSLVSYLPSPISSTTPKLSSPLSHLITSLLAFSPSFSWNFIFLFGLALLAHEPSASFFSLQFLLILSFFNDQEIPSYTRSIYMLLHWNSFHLPVYPWPTHHLFVSILSTLIHFHALAVLKIRSGNRFLTWWSLFPFSIFIPYSVRSSNLVDSSADVFQIIFAEFANFIGSHMSF